MYGARLDGDLNFANPPAPDEIEVSVFGPGIGESIVVHVGNSKWICVDCAKYDNKAWPTYYLSKLGVPVEGSVSLIVATHWHSDHVDGLSEVVAASQLSPFVCSQALRVDEFKQVIGRYISADRDRIRAPLGEIQRIFGIYLDRRKQDAQYPAPTFASSGQLLMQSGTGTERVQLTAVRLIRE
jgi:glyoxylase-like metal-dependent hydrolase (beta-lactamase superfamily II)